MTEEATPRGGDGRDGSGEPTEGEPASALRLRHGYLEGVGDVRIFHRVWEVRRPRRRVVLVHGLGDHSGRYVTLARELAAAGCSVFAPDLRGHGRSRGPRGHASDFGDLLRDLDRVRRLAAVADGGTGPVCLVGHSLGGLVVLRYLQVFGPGPVDRLVSVAPFVRLAAPVPSWRRVLGRAADRVAPALALDTGLDEERVLRDPREREAHRADPLVHRRITARLWGEMKRAAAALVEEAGPPGVPVLFQVPGDDRVVEATATRSLAGAMGPEAEVRGYPGAYHDLYHDPAGPEARADAVGWILGRDGRG